MREVMEGTRARMAATAAAISASSRPSTNRENRATASIMPSQAPREKVKSRVSMLSSTKARQAHLARRSRKKYSPAAARGVSSTSREPRILGLPVSE